MLAKIQRDWFPHKKGKLGHTEGYPFKNTGGRQPSTSPGEKPQNRPTADTLISLRLPSPQYSEKINLCYLRHSVFATSLWQAWKLIHPQISQQEEADREGLSWPPFSALPATWSIFPLSLIFTWMRFSPFLGKQPACTYRGWQKWSHECGW